MFEFSKFKELKGQLVKVFSEGEEKEDLIMTNVENRRTLVKTRMSNTERSARLNKISTGYKERMLNVRPIAEKVHNENRARVVAGIIREQRGQIVEDIARELVVLACDDLGIERDRLSFLIDPMRVGIIGTRYLNNLDDDVANYVARNINNIYYNLDTDVPVIIDGKLVANIECKSYTEIAMLKRVMFDSSTVHEYFPEASLILLQLENSLGGDYAQDKEVINGSDSAHVIMSRFPNFKLEVLTLLDGSRKANRPITDPQYFKPMSAYKLAKAYKIIRDVINERVREEQVLSQRRVYLHNYDMRA